MEKITSTEKAPESNKREISLDTYTASELDKLGFKPAGEPGFFIKEKEGNMPEIHLNISNLYGQDGEWKAWKTARCDLSLESVPQDILYSCRYLGINLSPENHVIPEIRRYLVKRQTRLALAK